MKQDPVQKARERFDDARSAFSEQRARMLEDFRFSNPANLQQWDEGVRRAREQSPGGARPCMTFDQTNQYVQNVVNDFRQNKPQINAIAATDGEEKVAEVLSGMIRQIEYESRASIAYDTAVEHASRVGIGWMRVVPLVTDPEYNLQTIRIQRVHDPLSVLAGPYLEPDGSDIPYGFVETTITKAAFKAEYPGKKSQSWDSTSREWFDDDSVRIVEYFEQVETATNHMICELPAMGGNPPSRITLSEVDYWDMAKKTGVKPKILGTFTAKTKTVEWSKMSGAEMLEETTLFPSQWVPLVPVHGYELWIEGKRFLCGMVRPMMDGQRALNFAASSDIEFVTQQPKNPWLVPWEAVEGHQAAWAGANASNKAFLPYDHKDEDGQPLPPPTRVAPPQAGAAFGRMADQAAQYIQASIGNYRSNLGAPSNAVSGRAKMQDERQGDTANFHYQDNGARSIEHLGRIIVDMIPTIYADTQYGPRDVRTLGIDGSSSQVTIDPHMDEPFQAKGKKVIAINPSVGKYGVRIKTGPAFASLREEAADSLTKIVQTSPQLMTVLGPMWARMQDWPEAEKVSKLLLALAPPEVQQIESDDDEIPAAAQAKIKALSQQVQQLSDALNNAAQQHQQLEQEVQSRAQVEQFKAQALAQREADKHEREIQFASIQAQSQQQVEQVKAQASMQMERERLAHEAQINDFKNSIAVELARINNAGQYDRTELQALALILSKGMPAPPVLEADTDSDIEKQQ